MQAKTSGKGFRHSTRLQSFLYKAKRRLFHTDRWVILLHRLDNLEPPATGDITLEAALDADSDAIIEALPEELVGHMTRDEVIRLVHRRKNIPCILASKNGRIVGGCWVPYSDLEFPLEKIGIHLGKSGELTTLFVIPEARGQGIATQLCRYICHFAVARQWNSCISLVWYSRQASIRSHLKAGFIPVGEKQTCSVLGMRWSRYSPHHRLPTALSGGESRPYV